MNPNAIEIRRVYTREVGEQVADPTIKLADTNEIVVEWEAGAAANQDNGPPPGPLYLEIITRNVTLGGVIPQSTWVFNPPPLFGAQIPVNTDGEAHNGTYDETRPFLVANGLNPNITYEITAVLHLPPGIVSFAKWMFRAI